MFSDFLNINRMPPPLFDRYIAVDWSAANQAKKGADSIWIARGSPFQQTPPQNIPTRTEAVLKLKGHIKTAVKDGRKLLIGFDFAFGYPAGTAARLGVSGWEGLWALLYKTVKDDRRNRSNRFEVAETLNQRLGEKEGPFWGRPWQHQYECLSPKKPKTLFQTFPEWRHVDKVAKGAKSVWQLTYNGAVGSQTLLGIAALEGLRRDPDIGPYISVWPYETAFLDSVNKPIILAEIYPSSHKKFPAQPYPVKDAQQVAQVVQDFRDWDKAGLLKEKMSPKLSPDIRHTVLTEESWTIGQSRLENNEPETLPGEEKVSGSGLK